MSHSKKKKKSSKPEEMFTIMKQISDLKQQLTTIKSRKELQTICQNNNKNKSLREERKVIPMIRFHEINFRQRQTKLKVTIEMNKIRKIVEKNLQKTDGQLVESHMNVLINIINLYMKQHDHKIKKINKELQRMNVQIQEQNSEKLNGELYKKKNRKLKQKIMDLKHYTCYYAQLLRGNQEEVKKQIKQSEQIQIYNKELQINNEKLRNEIMQLKKQKIQIVGDIKEIKGQYEKKEQQHLEMKEDVNFYKLQYEKQKGCRKKIQKQKQQASEMYEEDIMDKNRKIKAFQNKIVLIQEQIRENNTVINEYNKLKLQYNKLSVSHTQKQGIIESKQQEIKKIKQKLCEISQINIQVIENNEKLQQQNEQLERNLTFCQQQIQNLTEQVNEIRKSNQRYKDKAFKSKMKEVKREDSAKSKTLSQIQELIKKHKDNNSSQDE